MNSVALTGKRFELNDWRILIPRDLLKVVMEKIITAATIIAAVVLIGILSQSLLKQIFERWKAVSGRETKIKKGIYLKADKLINIKNVMINISVLSYALKRTITVAIVVRR